MTSKKTTRRALVTSILSLLLCLSMLVGTTFAWFTDSVTSGKNTIVAGNLDVELYYKLDADDDWEKVTSETELFDDAALWEPGYTQVVYLKVVNEGTLALKYQLGVNIISEKTATNVNGDIFKLSDYIEFDAIETAEEKTYADRDAARAAVTDSKIISEGYAKASKLEKKGDAEYVTLVVYMPEEVGNEANYRGTAPEISLGLNLLATQQMYEEDSFDNTYDNDADYLPKWDGKATEVPAEVNGVITITNAGELAALSEAVAAGTSYSGKTIQLAADLNLANQSWTPIGACDSETYFQGTFDGQGHTIYGLNVDKSADDYMYSTAGLFGWIDAGSATIKNVNIDGATVKGSHWVGALVGYMTGTVENCTVTNSTVIGYNVNSEANGDKVGGLVGYMNSGSGKLEGNTVSNTTVAGYRDVAGLAGAVATTNSVKNNTVENSTVVYEADYAAAIVSAKTPVVVDGTNKAVNVIVTNGEVVADGVVKTGNKAYQVVSKAGLMNLAAVVEPINIWDEIPINVTLMVDVDMTGEQWTPINKMRVNFDGKGHTISNLECTEVDNKSGFYGYLGGSTISNLTLENVTATGSQAGIFAGQAEGGNIVNCTIDGENTVTWDDASTDAITGNGVGAFTGVSVSYGKANTISGTIAEGATVTLNKGAMTEWATTDNYYGGFFTADYETLTPVVDVTNNGEIKITVAKSVATDAELADALTSNEAHVVIDLTEDVSWKYPARSAYCGAATESITINGNGNTLTLVQGDSDWASIGMANADGVLTLNNVNVVKAEHAGNGAWNNHAINFHCDVVLTDVTFDNSVALHADGELKNVTITDDGGYYGLIVTAEGNKLTADNLTITSERAIKVMDQYVAAADVEKVTLTISNAVFTTTKKAAILVTSTAGADITLTNVDLSKVKADTTNAVWVDEARTDYAGLVTVTGGTVVNEPNN